MSLYQTLESLANSYTPVALSVLAKKAGFRSAYDKTFRQHLEVLIQNKVVKILQHGWKSEKRGSKNHPKVVILKASVWNLQVEAKEEISKAQAFLILHSDMEKEPIQKFVHRRRCCKCPDFAEHGTLGFCKQYGWEIDVELAEKQTLCYYGDEEIRVLPISPMSPNREILNAEPQKF